MKLKRSKNPCTNFKNAIMEFLWQKFKYKFEKGDYDSLIKDFLDAKTVDCTLTFKVRLVPNDIIVMRLLAGGDLDDKIIENIKKLWDKKRGE